MVLELEQGRMDLLQGLVDLRLGAISELRTSLITSFLSESKFLSIKPCYK